jgi:putative ABC transport system permease protein
MKASDLTELATRNLREAVLRNSLTTLGIAVGVASLVALLSLGVGLQNLVDRSVAHAGLFDTISVRPRQSMAFGQPGGGRRQPRDASDLQPPRALDDAARKAIATLPNVLEVNPEIRFTAEARRDANTQLVLVAGKAASSQASGNLDGLTGNFFSGNSVAEVIVQGDLAKRLSADGQSPATLLGQEITLRYAQRQALPSPAEQSQATSPNQAVGPDEEAMGYSIVPSQKTFRVVGVLPSTDSGSGQVGFNSAGMYIPLAAAEELQVVQGADLRDVARSSPAVGTRYAALNVRASSPAAVKELETSISHLGFATFSLIDITRNLRTFFAIFDLFLGIFGSLALAVASLGIINTLVMAILERRREIGVLKALGAADSDVRQLFFLEAGAMGFVGGIFGVILGWIIGRAIQLGTAIYLKRQGINAPNIWSVPWWLVLAAVAFAIIISLVAGIYPASRAAKLNPVEALRYE